jgi:hypothetical protein
MSSSSDESEAERDAMQLKQYRRRKMNWKSDEFQQIQTGLAAVYNHYSRAHSNVARFHLTTRNDDGNVTSEQQGKVKKGEIDHEGYLLEFCCVLCVCCVCVSVCVCVCVFCLCLSVCVLFFFVLLCCFCLCVFALCVLNVFVSVSVGAVSRRPLPLSKISRLPGWMLSGPAKLLVSEYATNMNSDHEQYLIQKWKHMDTNTDAGISSDISNSTSSSTGMTD